MTAETSVQATIDQAWTQALAAQQKAENYSDQAVSASRSVIFTGSIPTLTQPTKPTVPSLPTDDLGQSFSNEYDSTLSSLKTLMDDRLSSFLATYYPDYTNKLTTITDWIENAITNGGTGLPVSVEAAIYDRARTRIDQTKIKAEKEVLNVWAQRGFALPGGEAAALVKEVQQDSKHAENNLARDIAIEQANREIENVRFAISAGASLQTNILNTATSYMNAIISVASQATTKANSLVNSIQSLYQLTSQYVNASVNAENLILRYEQADINRSLTLNQLDINAFQAGIDARVNAALAGAKAMGNVASAAISSQNTIASISNETQISQ